MASPRRIDHHAGIDPHRSRWSCGPVDEHARRCERTRSRSARERRRGRHARQPYHFRDPRARPRNHSGIAPECPGGINCSALQTINNTPSWAATVAHIKLLAAGLPPGDANLPYAGFYPNQMVNGQMVPGDTLLADCQVQSAGVEPPGVDFEGTYLNAAHVSVHPTIDSNSLRGILNVNATQSFYPDSGIRRSGGPS